MDTIHSSFEKVHHNVSVSLHKSPFLEEGELAGKVTRNVATLENIIADIMEHNPGIDPYVIMHSINLLHRQILISLKQGKSVNLLDLGVMYFALDGAVKGSNPGANDIPELKIRFTPSELTLDAVKNLEVDKVVVADNSPKVNVVKDVWTDTDNNVLTPGKVCYISGKSLKLGGDVSSLSLIKVDSEGNEDSSAAPFVIEPHKIFINTKSMIYFFIPEDLDNSSRYKIRITTSYLTSSRSRKNPVTVDTKPLSIVS